MTRLCRCIHNDRLALEWSEGARRRYTIDGDPPGHHAEAGTDFAAIEDGEFSVTPLHFRPTYEPGLPLVERLLAEGVVDPVEGAR